MTGKWVIRVRMQQRTGYILCAEKSGLELFYQFRPQGFLKMADDRTGSVRDVCLEVLCQSMTANNGGNSENSDNGDNGDNGDNSNNGDNDDNGDNSENR